MVSFDTSIPGPGRVVIYGRKGALAGDLAAGLSGVFQVEQVATLPEAVHALVEPTLALLVIADDAAAVSDPIDCEILVHRAAASRCRVLVLGEDGAFGDDVERLMEVPGPAELACRLVETTRAGKV